MSRGVHNKGFSLAEVMMATGILAIGFVFIAGVFPVGVKLTAVATEQTIAPIVADEAFAKIRLYADPNFVGYLNYAQSQSPTEYINFADVLNIPHDHDEFTYPSTDISPERKKYHWSAFCGLLLSGDVHVTVFVTRISGAGTRYLTHESNYTLSTYGQVVTNVFGDRPVPVRVQVSQVSQRRLEIVNSNEAAFINSGSTIVDDQFDIVMATGWQIYRVLERLAPPNDDRIMLDRDWEGPANGYIWVIPPAVMSTGPPVRVGGRNPCIVVYQRVIGF